MKRLNDNKLICLYEKQFDDHDHFKNCNIY